MLRRRRTRQEQLRIVKIAVALCEKENIVLGDITDIEESNTPIIDFILKNPLCL